jgi:hypothetical protein
MCGYKSPGSAVDPGAIEDLAVTTSTGQRVLLPDAIRLAAGGARSRELSSGAVELSSKAVELSSEAAERRPVVAGAPLSHPVRLQVPGPRARAPSRDPW